MNLRNIPQYFKAILGISKDTIYGFIIINSYAKFIIPNYKFTWPELKWFNTSKLLKVLGHFDELESFNAHRRFALQQLLRLTLNVSGDTENVALIKDAEAI